MSKNYNETAIQPYVKSDGQILEVNIPDRPKHAMADIGALLKLARTFDVSIERIVRF